MYFNCIFFTHTKVLFTSSEFFKGNLTYIFGLVVDTFRPGSSSYIVGQFFSELRSLPNIR